MTIVINIVSIGDDFVMGSIRQLPNGKWVWHGLGRRSSSQIATRDLAEKLARRAFGSVRFEEVGAPIADQFKTSRYGYYDDDLVFHETVFDEISYDHPYLSRMQWFGGDHDYLIARAVEKSVTDALTGDCDLSSKNLKEK